MNLAKCNECEKKPNVKTNTFSSPDDDFFQRLASLLMMIYPVSQLVVFNLPFYL